MSDVDRSRSARVREALLDFAWRDPYTRWYLLLTWIGYGLIAYYSHGWALPLGVVWQLVVGWTVDKVRVWDEAQAAFDEQMRKER